MRHQVEGKMQEGTKNREAFEQYTDEELILRLHRAEDGSGDTQIMDFLMDKYKNPGAQKSEGHVFDWRRYG